MTEYAISDADDVVRLRGTISPPIAGLPSWFQQGAGSPIGVVVPVQTGALYQDTSAGGLCAATGPTSAEWVAVGGGVIDYTGGDTIGVVAFADPANAGHGTVYIIGGSNEFGSVFISDQLSISGPGLDNGLWWVSNGADGQQVFNLQLGSTGQYTHSWDAEGAYNAPGGVGMFGVDPPNVKPAAPVTLGDVIALLQSYGLSA